MLVLLGEAPRSWHPKRHGRVKHSLLDKIKIPTHAVALKEVKRELGLVRDSAKLER